MRAPGMGGKAPAAAARVTVTGGFWKERMDTVIDGSIQAQWRALNDEIAGAVPSHAMENFRIAAGEVQGSHQGTIWQDSDVAKWIEAASNSLAVRPDAALEARLDGVIATIAKVQWPDGYLNTYFTLVAPDKRWTDLAWGHELYCAGHLIEAAVAHNAATGKTTLLGVARRLADCIDATFGPEEGKNHGCCGHPEVELALFRLYETTGEERYARLARHFVEVRGEDPELLKFKVPLAFDIPRTKWFDLDYFQAHEKVRRQKDAVGHAVRAMYLYSAMADICRVDGDLELHATLRRLWDSTTRRRMYITGSIGSQAHGERFTIDWDLPPDTAYAETCACIGLALWAGRMLRLDPDSRYADVIERTLYNGILSGLSRDGSRYFYVNPLESQPSLSEAREDHSHVLPARVEWLGCACCPPNIARTVTSFPSLLYGTAHGTLYVHQYAASEAEIALEGQVLRLVQETDYPWQGRIRLSLGLAAPAAFVLALRIPSWCSSFSCAVKGEVLADAKAEGGYLRLARSWQDGDRVELDLAMPPRLIRADPRVRELAGKVAVQRGPLIYCAEESDNGPLLHRFAIDPSARLEVVAGEGELAGVALIKATALKDAAPPQRAAMAGSEELYAEYRPEEEAGEAVTLRLLPYHLWGNRGPAGEMAVWLRLAGPSPRRGT